MRKPHPNARRLRRDMPEAERRLWVRLKNRQLGGLRFRRQHTIAGFIADFACIDARLVIELDGDQHGRGDTPARDAARDRKIEGAGFFVLRVWNDDVVSRIDDVLVLIFETAIARLPVLDQLRTDAPPSVSFADTSPASGGGKTR